MPKTKTTTTRGKSTAGTATQTARSGAGGGGGTGGGAGVSTQAAPLGIPSGGAAVPAATPQSTQTQGGVNWANVQQQFPTIAWNHTQLATLMANIALGPGHYPAGEYQAMLTQFRTICGEQVRLFERLHLGARELVNA